MNEIKPYRPLDAAGAFTRYLEGSFRSNRERLEIGFAYSYCFLDQDYLLRRYRYYREQTDVIESLGLQYSSCNYGYQSDANVFGLYALMLEGGGVVQVIFGYNPSSNNDSTAISILKSNGKNTYGADVYPINHSEEIESLRLFLSPLGQEDVQVLKNAGYTETVNIFHFRKGVDTLTGEDAFYRYSEE